MIAEDAMEAGKHFLNGLFLKKKQSDYDRFVSDVSSVKSAISELRTLDERLNQQKILVAGLQEKLPLYRTLDEGMSIYRALQNDVGGVSHLNQVALELAAPFVLKHCAEKIIALAESDLKKMQGERDAFEQSNRKALETFKRENPEVWTALHLD
jgi:hypothetical protein